MKYLYIMGLFVAMLSFSNTLFSQPSIEELERMQTENLHMIETGTEFLHRGCNQMESLGSSSEHVKECRERADAFRTTQLEKFNQLQQKLDELRSQSQSN